MISQAFHHVGWDVVPGLAIMAQPAGSFDELVAGMPF